MIGKARGLTTQGGKVLADQVALHVIVGPKLGLQFSFKGCLWPPSMKEKKSSSINFIELVRPVRRTFFFWIS